MCLCPIYSISVTVKELTKTHNTMHEAIFEISLRKSITQDFRKSIFDIPFFAMRV